MENVKKIKGFENYTININGEVYSNNRNIILKGDIVKGYKKVTLCKDGKTKKFLLHRLIAEYFIPNDNIKLTIINHIDGNKLNNLIDNLEWVDTKNNLAKAYELGLNKTIPPFREVQQFDLNGNFIAEYESIMDASRKTNSQDSKISMVCKGKRKSHNNYIWKYKHNEQ